MLRGFGVGIAKAPSAAAIVSFLSAAAALRELAVPHRLTLLLAAVTVRGEVVAGVIYDPVCRDWAYAVRGGGAWIEQEDGTRSPLRVADPAPLSGMDGLIGTTFLQEPLRTTVNGKPLTSSDSLEVTVKGGKPAAFRFLNGRLEHERTLTQD